MTDNQPDLRQALQAAVLDPPNLADLASRAEAGGRKRRARCRAAAGVGAAAVVAAVMASLAFGSGTSPDVAQDNPSTKPNQAAACVNKMDTSSGRLLGTSNRVASAPVSVRFCDVFPLGPVRRGPAAVVPDTALTTEVTQTVEALEASVSAPRTADCARGRNQYLIQIAYDDGTFRNLPDQDCDRGFSILLEALGRQQGQGYDQASDAVTCADHGVLDGSGDAYIDPLQPLTRLPAVAAVRCIKTDGVVETSPAEPEALRAALLSDTTPGMVDCAAGSSLPTVRWVLRMADGTLHTVTFDRSACGGLYLDNKYVGLGGRLLADLAES